MHFDPTKEEIDLPPCLVQGADAQGEKRRVVADEQQTFSGVGILVSNAAK